MGERRDGRPVWGLDFKAFFPPCSSASFHRLTDDGAAPIVRATSRMPRPLANRLAANRRLVSSFAALPFGLMNPLLGFLPATLEDKGASSVKKSNEGFLGENDEKRGCDDRAIFPIQSMGKITIRMALKEWGRNCLPERGGDSDIATIRETGACIGHFLEHIRGAILLEVDPFCGISEQDDSKSALTAIENRVLDAMFGR